MALVRGVEPDVYVAGDIEGQDVLLISPYHRINALRVHDEEGNVMKRK
jgi:hypothetical protein